MNFAKNIRKFRKQTRAISPVIATLLMIAIAVVASLVVYAWVMGYMGFQTEKTGQAIQVQSVTYNELSDVDTFKIYVQNVGDSDVKITSVYINGVLSVSPIFDPAGGVVAETTTSTITAVTTATQLDDGVQQVTIKVVAESGTFAEVTKQFTIK